MSVTITTLESELQARITALDGSESSADLLLLAKAITPAMSIDRSNLDAKLQTKVNAISGASDMKDIMLIAIASNEDPKTQIRSIQRLTLSGTGNAVISPVDMSKTTVNLNSTYASGVQGGSANHTLSAYARLINPATVEYNTNAVNLGTLTMYVEVIEYV